MTPRPLAVMAAVRTDHLPELITGKQAMQMLGIRHRKTFARFVDANPSLACKITGLRRPKYRRAALESILRATTA